MEHPRPTWRSFTRELEEWVRKNWVHHIGNNLLPVWIKGGRVEKSRVKFAKNKLILDHIYFTLLFLLLPQFKQTIKVENYKVQNMKVYKLISYTFQPWP